MSGSAAERSTAFTITAALPIVEVASFTRERVERVMARSVAIGCGALGAQALIGALADREASAAWAPLLSVLAFAPLAVMLAAFLLARWVRPAGMVFISAYVVVLLLWPVATAGTTPAANSQPWVYFLVNVATVASVLVMRMPMQLVTTLGLPILYGIVRFVQLRGDVAAVWPLILDVSFALILGSVLLTLGWAFRGAASQVDERRVHAVSSYARAAAVTASERERVAVAALMHDSVLAALIAAERADTPREQELAVSMAREALTRLANTDRDVGEGSDAPMAPAALVQGIRELVRDAPGAPQLRVRVAPDAPEIPGRVARGLVLAAAQAVANAVEHADAAALAVDVTVGDTREGVVVQVADAGPGFDLENMPADRLGIRASIIARVAALGGRSVIDSGPDGTTVTLSWHGGTP